MALSKTRTKMLADILITAVEGGTGYWASVSQYHWSDEKPEDTKVFFHVEDEDDETEDKYRVGVSDINAGILKIANDETFQINDKLRREIKLLDISDGEGFIYEGIEWDADTADVIVQAALFGEIVYG